jgi:hypothetical protein
MKYKSLIDILYFWLQIENQIKKSGNFYYFILFTFGTWKPPKTFHFKKININFFFWWNLINMKKVGYEHSWLFHKEFTFLLDDAHHKLIRFHKFIQKWHKFCAMINMNDICTVQYFKYPNKRKQCFWMTYMNVHV